MVWFATGMREVSPQSDPMTSDSSASSRWVADAEAYDAWLDRPWGVYAMAVEHRLLVAAVPPLSGLQVCDAGCGTGRLACRL